MQSTCMEDHFEKKQSFRGNKFCRQFCTWSGKEFNFWRQFFCTVVKTAFWVCRTFLWLVVNKQFCFFFEIWARLCWSFGVKFLAILSKLHSLIEASVWRETNLSKKKSISYCLGLGEEIILTTDNLGSALLTWLRFVFLEHTFDTLFQQFHFFWSKSIFEYEFLPCLAQILWHSCQKYVSPVQTMFDEKLVVRWKV